MIHHQHGRRLTTLFQKKPIVEGKPSAAVKEKKTHVIEKHPEKTK
jgi:hypothetical protein